ncbi:T9SS type A sorting domain-containing protein, partial [Bacteroidota bacterium]
LNILLLIVSYSFSFSQTMPNYSGTPSLAGCTNSKIIMAPDTHNVEFNGVIYDFPHKGESTWLYNVVNSTAKKVKAISHTSFPINLSCVSPVTYGNNIMAGKYTNNNGILGFSIGMGDPVLVNPDPQTGVIGLKFDEGFDNQTTAYYFYVLSGNPDISVGTVALKAGGGVFTGNICGPEVFTKIPITVTGLNSSYETDDSLVSFTINPSSATVNGPGINGLTFDPHIAGGGTIILDIDYQLPGGCGVQHDTIQVHVNCSPKSVSISGVDTHYYMYDPIVSLVGIPSGGDFSGPGVDVNTFKANLAGLGDHYIYYTYYDAPNCAWVDSSAKITVECCDVPIIVEGLPPIVELEDEKPDDFTPIIIKAYPKGGQFITTSNGLRIIETKGDSAIAEFDVYLAGPGNHSIEYTLGDTSCTIIDAIYIAENDGSNPLPIELLYLNATCGSKSEVLIKWSTASETNNDFFTLFKSTDGENWVVVENIKGSGSSNEVNNYEFTDETPEAHDTYYKLKQTDFNGESKEFEIIFIYCKFNHKKITLYPNPAKDNINLSFINEHQVEKPLKVSVYNNSGQIVHTQEFFSIKDQNLHNIKLPDHLKTGNYFIHVMLGNEYFYTSQISVIK